MGLYNNHIFNKYPEFREIICQFRYEMQQSQRPANEIILDDEDVMLKMKISKRTLQYMVSDGKIPTHKFDPDSPRRYFLLSDILEILKKNRIEAITSKF